MGYKIKLNENQLTKLISEQSVERPCSKFDTGTKNHKFCMLINSPKYIKITRPLVDKVLEQKKKKWRDITSSEKQGSIEEILDIIEETKPQASQTIQRVREKLDSLGFVYDEEDQWDYINKLNTNYSDTATFITDLVDQFGDYPIEQLYDDMVKGNTLNLEHLIGQALNAPDEVYNQLVNDPTDKFKYTRMAKYYTGKGDAVEDIIQNLMEENGWTTIHRGGNGDPIDTLLGIDLIVEKNGRYKFIQSKKVFDIRKIKTPSNPNGAYRIQGNVFGIRKDMVDVVGYATEDGRAILTTIQSPQPTRNSHAVIEKPFQDIHNLGL